MVILLLRGLDLSDENFGKALKKLLSLARNRTVIKIVTSPTPASKDIAISLAKEIDIPEFEIKNEIWLSIDALSGFDANTAKAYFAKLGATGVELVIAVADGIYATWLPRFYTGVSIDAKNYGPGSVIYLDHSPVKVTHIR